jgi:hypothetical protein
MMLLNAAPRESDKLRIFFTLDKLPTLQYLIQTLGNFTLALGIAVGIYPIYGLTLSVIFACVISIFCGIIPLIIN